MGLLDSVIGRMSAAPGKATPALQHRVVLGALLSLVAHAEGGVVAEEIAELRKVLHERGVGDVQEQDEIVAAAQQALKERLDWEGFTRKINQVADYDERVALVRDLFRIARADGDLAHQEHETIRKLSDLLWVSHADFIQAKLATR